jgi:hypothetical protein
MKGEFFIRNYLLFMVVVSAMLVSCTSSIENYYKSADGEFDNWIRVDKDTSSDVGVYISMLNGQPTAGAVTYCNFDRLHDYKRIDIQICNVVSDTLNVELSIPDGSKEYFTVSEFSKAKDEIIKRKRMPGEFSLRCSRTYMFDELPQQISVNYLIETADTTVIGQVLFDKVTEKTTDVMRWH